MKKLVIVLYSGLYQLNGGVTFLEKMCISTITIGVLLIVVGVGVFSAIP
jgi:hypothetical protein